MIAEAYEEVQSWTWKVKPFSRPVQRAEVRLFSPGAERSEAAAVWIFVRQHAYWCPAGCRGPEAAGTFEVIECPACGSHETSSMPRGDGVEEVECDACGTITTLQMVQTNP